MFAVTLTPLMVVSWIIRLAASALVLAIVIACLAYARRDRAERNLIERLQRDDDARTQRQAPDAHPVVRSFADPAAKGFHRPPVGGSRA